MKKFFIYFVFFSLLVILFCFLAKYNAEYSFEILKITIPAITSVAIVMIARYFEKQKEYEAQIREKKIKIYENFFMFQYKFLMEYEKASESQKRKLENELQNELRDFIKNLMFWGSSEIILAYNKLQSKINKPNHRMEDFEEFYFALRKDIGHNNKNLKTFDLLHLMLKADEFDENGKPKKSTIIS